MQSLAVLFRNLLYHALRLRCQPGSLIIVIFAGLITYAGSALFAHIDHLYQYLVNFIGSVVVLRFLWHHGNDALEEIHHNDQKIQQEARRTGRILKDIFGLETPIGQDTKNQLDEVNDTSEQR